MPERGPGRVQRQVLQTMRSNSDFWYRGCGWTWTNASTTERIMESLERRGYVTKSEKVTRSNGDSRITGRYTRWDITELGKKASPTLVERLSLELARRRAETGSQPVRRHTQEDTLAAIDELADQLDA